MLKSFTNRKIPFLNEPDKFFPVKYELNYQILQHLLKNNDSDEYDKYMKSKFSLISAKYKLNRLIKNDNYNSIKKMLEKIQDLLNKKDVEDAKEQLEKLIDDQDDNIIKKPLKTIQDLLNISAQDTVKPSEIFKKIEVTEIQKDIKTYREKLSINKVSNLDEEMIQNSCYIENKIPIEVLDPYEQRILYDLRRIPGLPKNPA